MTDTSGSGAIPQPALPQIALPQVKVLTVSDGVVHGTRDDLSGRALVAHLSANGFEVDSTPPSIGTWRPFEQGWRVLPHDTDTDAMVLIRYRRIS